MIRQRNGNKAGGIQVLVMTRRFPPLEYRAISQVAYDQALALTQKGAQVTVITQSDSAHNSVKENNGILVHQVGRPNYQASSWETEPLIWTSAYLDYIRNSMSLSQCDVIHTHGIDFALLVQFLVQIYQIPIISQFHVCFRARADIGEAHFNLELAHYYQYYTAQRASVVIAVSDADKQKLVQALDCANKAVVVPNGLNLAKYRYDADARAKTRHTLKIDNEFVVLWGGRIGDFMKAPDIVGRAFSRLVTIAKATRLLVAVVQNEPPECASQLFGHLSTEALDRTIVVQPETKEKLLALYSAADVFIMPSRYEPFGLMALEAMALGLPVVVSPNDGLDELVEDGRTGLKIKWGSDAESADSLVHNIMTLMESSELARFLGTNAKASASRFSIERVTDRLLDVYQDVHIRSGRKQDLQTA
jgi:glycosyltransferase involved in cell wall biosynthesis